MESRKSVIVINRSSPELNYLAAGLAKEGLLKKYIRPYANQNRLLEKILTKLPGFHSTYKRTFGRRVLPAGLDGSLVKETGVFYDIANSTCHFSFGRRAQRLSNYFENRLQEELWRVGETQSLDAGLVVGAYSFSKAAFLKTSGKKVLNYPITHHNYSIRVLEEEKVLDPSFAAMSINEKDDQERRFAILNREIELADKILVGSTFAKKSFILENVPEEKIEVIPYGVDISLFNPSNDAVQKDNNFNIIFVGQVCQRKGISYLLQAYKKFKGPATSLTVVGQIIGDDKPLVPYRSDFTYIPHAPRVQLPSYYQKADVFVFPTLLEGLGLVVLEAMACGIPVITTSNGPDDIVRDGVDGFVVPSRNVDAIVEKLEFLRANPEIKLQMGRNSRERAKTFTWDRYKRIGVNTIYDLLI